MSLTDDVKAARALGLSYGKYKALTYHAPEKKDQKATPPAKKRRTKKYTDQQLFDLWQQGKTDAEIGAAVGVSRAMIQKWRDILEIPSVAKCQKDRKKYRLVETQFGTYVVYSDNEK